MTALYDSYRQSYEKGAVFPQQLDDRELTAFASLVKGSGQRVLDIGCAEGKLSLRLAGQGHAVVASDIAQAQLDNLEALRSESGSPGLTAVRCDIEEKNAPLAGTGPFDYIYLMDVIEHLRSPLAALTAIRPLVAPGGTLIIHTPNTCTIRKFLRYLLRPRRLTDFFADGRLFDLHIGSFDYMTLEKLLNFAGFRITQVVPTRLSVPGLERSAALLPLFTAVAKLFPLLGDTLLVTCEVTDPVDPEALFRSWRSSVPIA